MCSFRNHQLGIFEMPFRLPVGKPLTVTETAAQAGWSSLEHILKHRDTATPTPRVLFAVELSNVEVDFHFGTTRGTRAFLGQ